jgi:hypothetical protein
MLPKEEEQNNYEDAKWSQQPHNHADGNYKSLPPLEEGSCKATLIGRYSAGMERGIDSAGEGSTLLGE